MPIERRPFFVARSGSDALHRQLVERLREAIRNGEFPAGSRLPPSRALAQSLGVNRGTVQKAYETLLGSGELRARVGQGTFVVGAPRDASRPATAGPWTTSVAESRPAEDPLWDRLATWAAEPGMISFAAAVPDARLFPVEALRAALDGALAAEGTALLQYGPPRGYPPFVEFLCQHLAERGVPVGPDRLLIVSGSQQGLDLVARTLLSPGDGVVVEEPTYSGALALFRFLGARLLPVPMDDEGMSVDHLEALLARERPRLLYTIPNFHNPTGRTLSRRRRDAVLALCGRAGVPIVEDDTDGELRFEGEPLPPLAALPGGSGVLYLGTFSKLFFPGLRLGWMAADGAIIERLAAAKRVTDLHTPPLLQAAMARCAARAEVARHADLVRRRYRLRRDVLMTALASSMPEGTTWTRPLGGLCLMVTLPAGLDATELLPLAVREGVLFAPGQLFSAERRAGTTLRLGFGSVDEDLIPEGVTRLARAIAAEAASPGRRGVARGRAAAPVPV